MRIGILLLVMISSLPGCRTERVQQPEWSLVLHQRGKAEIEVVQLPVDFSKSFSANRKIDGIEIDFSLTPTENYSVFKATASKVSGPAEVYLALRCHYTNQEPYNFNGRVDSSEIFRQSPHDVNAWISEQIAKQAVPVIALKSDSGFVVALNGSPALYNNFTSQAFYVDQNRLELSSGDNGKTPGLKPDTVKQLDIEYNTDKTQVMAPGRILAYYHPIDSTKTHVFEGILFRSKAANLNGLRKDVNQLAAHHFSAGKYNDYFGALAFTTAYMNLRVNETGKSKYWVVPSVEYGNTQYGRDAFWISTMLAPADAAECMRNELDVVNEYAEYPLFAMLWAYRSYRENGAIDTAKIQAYVDAIETRARNNYFYSYLERDGRLDFQYWGDVIAFEKDDVIAYNQGLFALALTAARELGLTIRSNPEKALRQYQNMYNAKEGFYPISKKKNILGPDPLIPDLLAQLYFNRKLLDSETVKSHFNRMVKYSKTSYGYKVVATPDGEYLPSAAYDIPNYVSQVNREHMPDGRYFKGGSYFLYDNLFLIDAWLHGIKEAEDELIWRTSLDFTIGNTTYECLNTKTGEPWKPNMGWNVAVYSIWRKLVDEGKAKGTLFDRIDTISTAPGTKQKE
ncbi:MAG: hypothetical protein JNM57_13000 [Cyclobacteriaceae bacterium]|nr:hypothetical protein [Cyclobacteriaceae bacterium]